MHDLTEQEIDAIKFVLLLLDTKELTEVKFGNFILPIKKGVKDKIQYNESEINLLNKRHQYTIPTLKGEVQLSMQFYENTSNHFRLFCYTKFGNKEGMTFSLNLTTEKQSEKIIYLTQKLKFTERYEGDSKIAQAHRRQKQYVISEILRNLEFDVTENNDIIMGIFDPTNSKLLNTRPEKLINDFLAISLIKGHFQGNKGFQLDLLPSFNNFDYSHVNHDENIENLPEKINQLKSKRTIPLVFRYKILKRDGFRCIACGRAPSHGVTLHIDHKLPFSLGGITAIENLQTLCNECNISKSNKFVDQ